MFNNISRDTRPTLKYLQVFKETCSTFFIIPHAQAVLSGREKMFNLSDAVNIHANIYIKCPGNDEYLQITV